MASEPGILAYIRNGDDLDPLENFIRSKGDFLRSDYGFIEEPGEREQLEAVLEMSVPGDRLYVVSIKAFYGTHLDDFKSNLKSIEAKKIDLISLREPGYDYVTYSSAIEVVQDDILEKYVRAAKRRKEKVEEEIDTLLEQKEDILRRGGRPKKEIQTIEALALYRTKSFQIEDICKFVGLSRSSLFRALADAEDTEDDEDEESQEQE